MKNIDKIKFIEYLKLMRVDKPIGFYLLLTPVLVSYIINRDSLTPTTLLVFVIGTFVMRSLGCVINDIWDRGIDRMVARTLNRPLAADKVTLKDAFKLVTILSSIAFSLVFFLKFSTFLISVFALVCTIIYPSLKRFFKLPQLGLALTFSISVLMMFNEANNLFSAQAIIIFLINSIWTFMYDTEYAMADKSWDEKLGIYSSAIAVEDKELTMISLLQITCTALLIIYGFIYEVRYSYYICIMSIMLFFVYQLLLVKTKLPELCTAAFKNNQYVGALWVTSLIL